MPSIKKNFTWSLTLTIAGYIFPLITFPYVARVLGAEGIGNYQFSTSVIQYFAIFACMGIGTTGIREIAKAKAKGDRSELSRIYSSLITLNLITTFLSIIILVILTQIVPSFIAHKKMLYIGTASILTGSLCVEWFYKGLEDFRYITVRAIVVRIIYVISVLIFVKKPDDYVIYFLLTTLLTVVNAIINQLYSRRFVSFSLKDIIIKPFLYPFLILGVYKILTSMYTSFNVMYLGFVWNDTEVGYYSTSVKLYSIIMSFFTAFTGVMLPRMSSLIAEKKDNEFKRLTSQSIDFLIVFSLPIIVITEFYAPEIIRILAGEGYSNAVLPMRIVMPLMFVIGYEQIIIIQMLFPLKKDKIILINSCVGAGVGLLLDVVLVPRLGCVGSAIVWCCSELAVLLTAQHFVTKYVGYKMPFNKIFNSILCITPAIIMCFLVNWLVSNWIISMAMGVVFTLASFVIMEVTVGDNNLLKAELSKLKERI